MVRRAKRGDEEAFRQLLELHRPAVTSTLIACGVRSADTARDLAQETAVNCWVHLSNLKDPQSFPAWIRRVAANAARDHLRRMAVRREGTLEEASDLAGSEDPHERAERSAEVRRMLEALGDEEESVVRLLAARAEGVSIKNLAEQIGLSEAALKMRLTRARKRLRQRLELIRDS